MKSEKNKDISNRKTNAGRKLLSVIIPAYNEEKTIKKIIDKVNKVKISIDKEIVVVNDGSTDNTSKILRKIKGIKFIDNKKNVGKGYAIRTGLKLAKGDIMIIQDADSEYNPNEYPKLIQPILDGKADVVYGSRMLGEIKQKKNWGVFKGRNKGAYLSFYMGGRIMTWLTNILFFSNITDEATCYKVFRADVLNMFELKCKRFEFCPEVTAKILKRGIKIKEVPITYVPRSLEEGKKINWKDGIEGVLTLLKYRFFD